MNKEESFAIRLVRRPRYIMAERELASFIRAVTELFGPEQARLPTEDWLEESELIDSPPEPRVEIGGP